MTGNSAAILAENAEESIALRLEERAEKKAYELERDAVEASLVSSDEIVASPDDASEYAEDEEIRTYDTSLVYEEGSENYAPAEVPFLLNSQRRSRKIQGFVYLYRTRKQMTGSRRIQARHHYV